MPVHVECVQCGKKYRVDEKFVGKKIRCKNCQAAIRVDAEPAAAAAVPVVKASAPAKTRPTVQVAGAAKRGGPQPEALDLPDLSGLDVPAGPTLQLDEEETSRQADPACPSCGAAFPAANRVCMGCGYNRASGQRAKTQVHKAARPTVGYASAAADRDSSGTRVWRAYDNGFLNFLDVAIPKAAMGIFIALSALSILSPLLQGMAGAGKVSGGAVFAGLVVQILSVVLAYTVLLKITVMGVELAGKMLKFEVPEDGRSRVLGVHMIATICAVIVMIIGILVTGAAAGGGGGNPLAVLSAMAGALLFSVATYLVVGCAIFTLLFHLRILEALLGYLLMIVFFIMGALVNGFILVVAAFILAMALGVGKAV